MNFLPGVAIVGCCSTLTHNLTIWELHLIVPVLAFYYFIGWLWSANVGYLLMMFRPINYLNFETFRICFRVHDSWFLCHCPPVYSICRHHAAQHSQRTMMERNVNLTCHTADWYMGTNDSDYGRHLFDGYNTQFVKRQFARDQ